MRVRVPIYVEERKPEAAGVQHVRPVSMHPLFFRQLTEQDVSLQRATSRLANELQRAGAFAINSHRQPVRLSMPQIEQLPQQALQAGFDFLDDGGLLRG